MKTIREETFGKALVRLVEMKDGYAGVVIRPGASRAPLYGEDPDELWRELVGDLAASNSGFFGFDGAKRRFLAAFPGGFTDPGYLYHERDYKVAAAKLLQETAPATAALTADADLCKQMHRVATKTNLLSRFELIRLKAVLDSVDGPAYARGAALFAQGEVEPGLRLVETALSRHGAPSWPLATYFPFLWDPAAHMFLKPMVMRDFAERVGDDFANAYSAGLKPGVYASLQRMKARMALEFHDLSPRDNIDFQGLIWVVGAYEDAPGEDKQTPAGTGA